MDSGTSAVVHRLSLLCSAFCAYHSSPPCVVVVARRPGQDSSSPCEPQRHISAARLHLPPRRTEPPPLERGRWAELRGSWPLLFLEWLRLDSGTNLDSAVCSSFSVVELYSSWKKCMMALMPLRPRPRGGQAMNWGSGLAPIFSLNSDLRPRLNCLTIAS